MKSNKLIAEFMGAYFDDKGMTRLCGEFGLERVSDLNLKYHSSWDWLMPVVEKIMWDNNIKDAECTNIEDALCDAKIDRVYDAVVEFINEYNKNK